MCSEHGLLPRGHVRASRAVAVVLTTCFLLVALPASAHTDLRSSNPGAGERLNRAPAAIRLVFNQEVAPQFVRLSLTKGDAGSPLRLDTQVRGARVVGTVPHGVAAEPGREPGRVHWRVDYRVVSADGHPIQGSLDFSSPSMSGTAGGPSDRETDSDVAGGSPGDRDARPPEGSGSPVLSTLVIGALVATAGLGAASWLSRARKQGEG
jgi:methionine-rich copper-binding protein CopC